MKQNPKTKTLPQEIAGKVEIIKHAIKENLNHVLNAEKFAEKGKNCIFDSCVELVLLARSVNKNPTYGWLCEEVYCVFQKKDCPIKPDIYKKAKSLGEVCAKLQPQQKENLRKVGCSRWQTIRKALSRYPKEKREVILNSLASASFDECSEALTQKVNDTAAAANIQPIQKEKSERQRVRDYFNAILKNITDDTLLKAFELYIASFNVPQTAMQNDTDDKPAEASATQPQEPSPERSATPNQTSTENDSDSAIPKTPSDIPTTNTPAANTQPQEMQMELFPTLDEFGDCENDGTVREQQHVNKFIALSPKGRQRTKRFLYNKRNARCATARSVARKIGYAESNANGGRLGYFNTNSHERYPNHKYPRREYYSTARKPNRTVSSS